MFTFLHKRCLISFIKYRYKVFDHCTTSYPRTNCTKLEDMDMVIFSGGSRISHWGGGTNFRCRHFLVKTYAKMKELDPIGGGGAGGTLLDPPMTFHLKVILSKITYITHGARCPIIQHNFIMKYICEYKIIQIHFEKYLLISS